MFVFGVKVVMVLYISCGYVSGVMVGIIVGFFRVIWMFLEVCRVFLGRVDGRILVGVWLCV